MCFVPGYDGVLYTDLPSREALWDKYDTEAPARPRVCVRDHWDEMEPEEHDWCVNMLMGEIDRDCDSDNEFVQASCSGLDPSRPAAYILPKVLYEGVSDAPHERVMGAIAKSLTHAVAEVPTSRSAASLSTTSTPQRVCSRPCRRCRCCPVATPGRTPVPRSRSPRRGNFYTPRTAAIIASPVLPSTPPPGS
jgi:hypothetical protein